MLNLCLKCGIEKPKTDFDVDNHRATGCASSCKKCKSEYNRKRWKRIRTRELPRKRAYHALHRAELNEYSKKWRKKNPRRHLEYDLKESYGMTLAEYDKKVSDQAGCCAICHEKSKGKKRLHVDHCHNSGRIRKLLCSRCNTAIGMMRDNIEILQNAIQYIQEHQEIKN